MLQKAKQKVSFASNVMETFVDAQPGETEIREYAEVLGIDPMREPELMWIAKEGILAPLPQDWKPVQMDNGDLYFFNFKTGESSWEHPSDEKYKQMVVEERKKLTLKHHLTQNLGVRDLSGAVSGNAKKPLGSVVDLDPPSASGRTGAPALKPLRPLSNTTESHQPIGNLKQIPSKLAPVMSHDARTKPTLAPIDAGVVERPKTSRGAQKPNEIQHKEAAPVDGLVGGGSKFLKKAQAVVESHEGKKLAADVLVLKDDSGPKPVKTFGSLNYHSDSCSQHTSDEDEALSNSEHLKLASGVVVFDASELDDELSEQLCDLPPNRIAQKQQFQTSKTTNVSQDYSKITSTAAVSNVTLTSATSSEKRTITTNSKTEVESARPSTFTPKLQQDSASLNVPKVDENGERLKSKVAEVEVQVAQVKASAVNNYNDHETKPKQMQNELKNQFDLEFNEYKKEMEKELQRRKLTLSSTLEDQYQKHKATMEKEFEQKKQAAVLSFENQLQQHRKSLEAELEQKKTDAKLKLDKEFEQARQTMESGNRSRMEEFKQKMELTYEEDVKKIEEDIVKRKKKRAEELNFSFEAEANAISELRAEHEKQLNKTRLELKDKLSKDFAKEKDATEARYKAQISSLQTEIKKLKDGIAAAALAPKLSPSISSAQMTQPKSDNPVVLAPVKPSNSDDQILRLEKHLEQFSQLATVLQNQLEVLNGSTKVKSSTTKEEGHLNSRCKVLLESVDSLLSDSTSSNSVDDLSFKKKIANAGSCGDVTQVKRYLAKPTTIHDDILAVGLRRTNSRSRTNMMKSHSSEQLAFKTYSDSDDAVVTSPKVLNSVSTKQDLQGFYDALGRLHGDLKLVLGSLNPGKRRAPIANSFRLKPLDSFDATVERRWSTSGYVYPVITPPMPSFSVNGTNHSSASSPHYRYVHNSVSHQSSDVSAQLNNIKNWLDNYVAGKNRNILQKGH